MDVFAAIDRKTGRIRQIVYQSRTFTDECILKALYDASAKPNRVISVQEDGELLVTFCLEAQHNG